MIDDSELLSLVEQSKQGDESSLDRLLWLFSGDMKSFLRGKSKGSEFPVSPEDIVQESTIDVVRGIRGFKGKTVCEFRGWLRTVVENRRATIIRSLLTEKRGGHVKKHSMHSATDSVHAGLEHQLSDSRQNPSSGVERTEAIQAVQINVDDLPSDQAMALKYRYIEGKSVDETARMMNRSTGSIRGLLSRAKASLKVAMGRSSKWFGKK